MNMVIESEKRTSARGFQKQQLIESGNSMKRKGLGTIGFPSCLELESQQFRKYANISYAGKRRTNTG
jgi:hypothetical protein